MKFMFRIEQEGPANKAILDTHEICGPEDLPAPGDTVCAEGRGPYQVKYREFSYCNLGESNEECMVTLRCVAKQSHRLGGQIRPSKPQGVQNCQRRSVFETGLPRATALLQAESPSSIGIFALTGAAIVLLSLLYYLVSLL